VQQRGRASTILAAVVVVLVIAIQVLSWQRTGGLNAGAFLLLILALGPLWSVLRGRNPDRL
jgi:hypothetical protein